MGAGQSGNVEIGGSSMGYQVLRVYPDSPGSRAGLKAYFDFIVAIGNTRFNKESGSLREILKASVDQSLKMVVFNTRTKTCRDVDIIPSTSWGGNGLLGVSIKHSSFDRADERVWHVVNVEPGSPAAQAGFRANEDFVIGSDSILQENDDLYNLIEAHEGKALKLFVYNTTSDNCREVICHPNTRWGGQGYLGCEFGHGLLHRIPYAGIGGDVLEDQRASLIRNEHPMGQQRVEQTRQFKPNSFSNPLMRQQMNQLNMSQQQPGQDLFQQALSPVSNKFSDLANVDEQPKAPMGQLQHQMPSLPLPSIQAQENLHQQPSLQLQQQQSNQQNPLSPQQHPLQHQQWPQQQLPSQQLPAQQHPLPQQHETLQHQQWPQQQLSSQQPSNQQNPLSPQQHPLQHQQWPQQQLPSQQVPAQQHQVPQQHETLQHQQWPQQQLSSQQLPSQQVPAQQHQMPQQHETLQQQQPQYTVYLPG